MAEPAAGIYRVDFDTGCTERPEACLPVRVIAESTEYTGKDVAEPRAAKAERA